ncbi:hypothetical protein JCM14722_05760 [Pseudodesulfovibrio portus]|uniref:Uncharacterized protein n=1 Tax=Pseudodesulfovibrio portus TaxID=231439 RepID=A0ABM8ANS5_9BACT|nr:hypothetical protein JCM14722_05760 [Pseudodesulfovibrio portus]
MDIQHAGMRCRSRVYPRWTGLNRTETEKPEDQDRPWMQMAHEEREEADGAAEEDSGDVT